MIVLFSGVPGTLKTSLAGRVAVRLGYAYLPTRAAGSIPTGLPPSVRSQRQSERYTKLGEMARLLSDAGADVVVDGSFTTKASRANFAAIAGRVDVVVSCRCSDQNVRRCRLQSRAQQRFDSEAASAAEMLELEGRFVASAEAEEVDRDDVAAVSDTILKVDTGTGRIEWLGGGATLNGIIGPLIEEMLSEAAPVVDYPSHTRAHFDELAWRYDMSTEWRQHPPLLQSLRVDLQGEKQRVLDVCCGTGLAGAWFAEQGHTVVGIDLAPAMLQRAGARLSLTVLGSAVRLPFIDEHFQLALLRQCLHYVDAARVLSDCHRVLDASGRIVLSATVAPDASSLDFFRDFKSATQPLRLRVYTPEDLDELLRGAGFRVSKRTDLSIRRNLAIDDVRRYAPEPPGGWAACFTNMALLGRSIVPSLDFTFDGVALGYDQPWCTLIGEKM